VILNLVNNAFYAVSEMKKRSGAGFEPKVSITTRVYDNGVEIIVMDNGTGIPESIKEKIMQPFFTTKPTGEGTGLGLSLSYDIIKAHGGEIKLETPGDGGTRFIVRLPVHPSAQVS
jgi:signal transduction histidine kinase